MAELDLTAPAVSADLMRRCLKYMKAEEIEDDPDEFALVQALMTSAIEYLDAAGVKRLDKTAARYDLLVCAMTLHMYDHRDDDKTEAIYPLNLRKMINQLKADSLIFS